MDLAIELTPEKVAGTCRVLAGTCSSLLSDRPAKPTGKHEHDGGRRPSVHMEDKSAEREHQKACKDDQCTRCKWLTKKSCFIRMTRLGGKSSASWLRAGYAMDGLWGLGCTVCHQSGGTSWFARFMGGRGELKPKTLAKHAESKEHKAAATQEFGPTGHPVGRAPAVEEFQKMLAELERGTSTRCLAKGTTSTKVRGIVWCLVEAMKEKDRKFLSKARSIVLIRDESGGRLLVRFGAVDKDLQVRRGFLGQSRDAGSKASNIVQATRSVLRDFCTTFHGSPSKALSPQLEVELYAHIKDRVEVIVNDSASNEILAAEVGRGRRAMIEEDVKQPGVPALRLEMAEKLTPNLILVGRDLARCFRRTCGARACGGLCF